MDLHEYNNFYGVYRSDLYQNITFLIEDKGLTEQAF